MNAWPDSGCPYNFMRVAPCHALHALQARRRGQPHFVGERLVREIGIALKAIEDASVEGVQVQILRRAAKKTTGYDARARIGRNRLAPAWVPWCLSFANDATFDVLALVTDPARRTLAETFGIWFRLLKVLVPALLAVRVLQACGAVEWIGALLSPAMSLVGLPDVLGIVWATVLLTNMFTGIVVFFEIAGDLPLSVEQVTVLGTLMLIGHSLPVEGAVARRAGVPWRTTIALRVGGALVLGALLHAAYGALDVLQAPASFVWRPAPAPDSTLGWALAQTVWLMVIFLIILVLVVTMKSLRRFGLERWIHLALAPLLRLLGIGPAAANVVVIGVALGLTYGAGLLIRDLDDGAMSPRDGYLALCFLGLVHSLVEDTLLILALGADLSGILWARLLFSIVVIAALARWLAYADRRAAKAEQG